MNKLRTSDLVNITGSKNDKLHDNITRLSKDTTWLDQKSISIYIYDIKKRVLLYNNSSSTTGSILPSKNLILPIWGLCNYNESHRDAATRIIKQ